MKYTIKEIIEEVGTKDINKIRALLSIPPFEKQRSLLRGRSGRCFVYDLDDKLLIELKNLYESRRKKNAKLQNV